MSANLQPQWFGKTSTDDAAQTRAIRSVVAATDFSEAAQHAVDRVAQLCARLGAAATLFTVDNAPVDCQPQRRFMPLSQAPTLFENRALSLMATELAAVHGIEVQAKSRRGNVGEQILLMARSSDLLAVGFKQRNPVHRRVAGSIAGRLVDRSKGPLLLVKQAPREPYRRVLVLTDFSVGSIAAAEFAATLAPGAAVHLFHAMDLREETEMRFAEVPSVVIEDQRLKRKASAQLRMDGALAAFGAVSSRYVHAFGHGDLMPLALLKQRLLDSDLLVVAKRVRPPLQSLLLWSMARRLSDDCPCDVLVVPVKQAT